MALGPLGGTQGIPQRPGRVPCAAQDSLSGSAGLRCPLCTLSDPQQAAGSRGDDRHSEGTAGGTTAIAVTVCTWARKLRTNLQLPVLQLGARAGRPGRSKFSAIYRRSLCAEKLQAITEFSIGLLRRANCQSLTSDDRFARSRILNSFLAAHRSAVWFGAAFLSFQPLSTVQMESTLQALLARRRVLSTALPQRSTARSSTTCASEPFDNADDPFALESNGFFTALHSAPSRAEDDNTVDTDAHQRPATSAVNKLNPNPVVVKDGRVLKGTGRKGRRFVANWTPEMDKALRKLLRKFGWGSWSRIAAAGKFPKEYTAKMISNRAKSIGLTRDMFDPGPVPSMSKKKKVKVTAA